MSGLESYSCHYPVSGKCLSSVRISFIDTKLDKERSLGVWTLVLILWLLRETRRRNYISASFFSLINLRLYRRVKSVPKK